MRKELRILGTRGIPARHGGFETFAEDLALHLVALGWRVTVYCQGEGSDSKREETWRGVRLLHIPVKLGGAKGTIVFDWLANRHAAREDGLVLTLGYNTAVFGAVLRWRRRRNLINMDGVEWRRDKYGPLEKAWLWVNEMAGAWVGDHLIADHPRIADHLQRWARADKITTIPYGARPVVEAAREPLAPLGLEPGRFAVVIARPEPENSILSIVQAFSAKPRGARLVVLGDYQAGRSKYQAAVLAAASSEVSFPGAIYDKRVVDALRFHALLYIHGHTVGGTNPSLVEAMAAGCPVLAHDNEFNRWVAGPEAAYFSSATDCEAALDRCLGDGERLDAMRGASRQRHAELFTLDGCLEAYAQLLGEWVSR